jgi:hypothetical protein
VASSHLDLHCFVGKQTNRHLLFHSFWERDYIGREEHFVREFDALFGLKGGEPCNCKSNLYQDKSALCELCVSRSDFLNKFIRTETNRMVSGDMWRDTFPEILDLAKKYLRRNIVLRMFDRFSFSFFSSFLCFGNSKKKKTCRTFSISNQDGILDRKMKSSVELTLEQMLIPAEYHSQAPWESAQRGQLLWLLLLFSFFFLAHSLSCRAGEN